MSMQFDSIEDALADIAAGEMVVVVDDDDRENEGDLIMAASKATPEKVAFMIRHTSGILCTPILEDQAKRLHNVVVRDIGRRDTTQMGGQMTELLKNVSPGKTSAPIPGDQGIELIAVCAIREVKSTQAAETRLETKMALAKGEEIGKEYLKELRDKAVIVKR